MRTASLINYALLEKLDPIAFRAQQPFPWRVIDQLLTTEAFETLLREFPAFDWFEKHENMPRANYQRPHNRFYLAYEKSIYLELLGFRCKRPALHLVHTLAGGSIGAGRKNNCGFPDVFRFSFPAKRIPHLQRRTEFDAVIIKRNRHVTTSLAATTKLAVL